MVNELIKVEVNENQEVTVSARELHEFLGIKTRFSDWWNSQLNYGFEEGEEFTGVGRPTVVNNGAVITVQDYAMKIDMAKELSMVSKSEKGKQARKYFIQLEKEWNDPTKVMARALILANNTINKLELKLEEVKPMVTFAETVANNADDIDMGEMAKLCAKENLKIGRNRLFEFLRTEKILMETNNLPYQKYIDNGWFTVIETTKSTPYRDMVFNKVLITGKGQIKIVELIRSKY